MTNCKNLSTPMEKWLKLSAKFDSERVNESVYKQLVGSLVYLTTTKPNLSFVVSFISRFMSTPKVKHWTAAKKVLRYVKGTLDFVILYSRSKNPRLSGYTNSDWAGSIDDKIHFWICLQSWHKSSHMDQQEATCSSSFIHKSRISRNSETSMQGSLA